MRSKGKLDFKKSPPLYGVLAALHLFDSYIFFTLGFIHSVSTDTALWAALAFGSTHRLKSGRSDY